jgi:cytosine/adenosine deaminase-related metal-dependent hydrolase
MIVRGVQVVGEGAVSREIVISGSAFARRGEASVHPAREGAVIDFDDAAIAFPGLVNSHDHLEFNVYPALGHRRYVDYLDWGDDIHRRDARLIALLERVPRPARLRWGALKNVLCGVTTVAHHGDSPDTGTSLPVDTVAATSIHSIRAAPRWRWRLNAPRDRSPYVFHVGEGTSSSARREVDELVRWNLFGRRLVAVHALGIDAEQATRFQAVVWCPVSNEYLYGATADVAAIKRRTAVLLGTDSTLTGDWNIWSHLRCARAHGGLDDRELFESVTLVAAQAWRRPKTGRIAPGLVANLVVARRKARNVYDAFFAVDPEDILLVLKGGAIVLCDASLDIRPAGQSSSVRIGTSEKWVAEDVPGIVAVLRKWGVQPNLPIAL